MTSEPVRLLELLSPPTSYHLLGALFTTYTFDARFFEEQALPTLFGLEVGEGETRRAASALHEGLLGAPVHVWCDDGQFHGEDRRLGTYDLTTVPPTFHPKVGLLVWARGDHTIVRAVVSSANLTHWGYRRIVEVAVGASSERPGDWPVIAAVARFLERLSDSTPGRRRASDRVLKATRHSLRASRSGRPPAPARHVLASDERPILDAIFDELDEGERIRYADVIAPSFDAREDPADAMGLRAFVERVTSRASQGFTGFYFGIPVPASEGRTAFPIGAIATELDRGMASLYALAPPEEEGVIRPLHGKLIAVETDRRCLVFAGSANLSAAALLRTVEQGGNSEVGVLMALPAGSSDLLWPGDWSQLTPGDLQYEQPVIDTPDTAGVIDHAQYVWLEERLTLHTSNHVPPPGWSVTIDDRELRPDLAQGAPTEIHVAHPERPVLLERWRDGSRWVPIEVLDKEELPPAPDMPLPSAEDLLSFLAGHQSKSGWDARAADRETTSRDADAPPVFERLPLFFRALGGLRESLHRPPVSELEYRARWRGSWGLNRLIDDLEARLDNGSDYPDHVLVLSLELLRVLEDVKCPRGFPQLRNEAQEALRVIRDSAEADVAPDVVAALRAHYQS